MSTSHATSARSVPAERPRLLSATTCLTVGLVALAATLAGITLCEPSRLALSWLIAMTFWTALSIGCLMLVLIHHIFDAGWSTVIRRTLEHWLAVFPWLGLLFAPLVLLSLFGQHDIIWPWMDTHAVAGDVLWAKKSGFLNPTAFVVSTVIFFLSWIWISSRLRKHSFAQDVDGQVSHTYANRVTAAFGIPLTALTLTFAAFYWLMSLEYHWFSTMFGVWFFSGSMRIALAFITLICIYLVRAGVLEGIFGKPHMLHLGNIMLAFTVFWAYITFSQYFLIWNANVPEETFWYNLREIDPSTGLPNSWQWVGYVLIFGHFVLPFLFFLQHPLKKKNGSMVFICFWILAIELLDFIYNILPSLKQASGDPVPFGITIWDVTALAAVGGLCFWAFLRSLPKTRCIPIRDPRIVESLQSHE